MFCGHDLERCTCKKYDDADPQQALAEVMEGTPMPSEEDTVKVFSEVTKNIRSFAKNIASVPKRHDNGNPLWLGPSGEGWNGGVTQSMIARFLSCRERFRLKYVLGLDPHDKWSHRLGYGNMWHVCEEALAMLDLSGCSEGAPQDWWESQLTGHVEKMLRQYPTQQEEIIKWWNVCKVQFPEYVAYWEEHPDVKNRTPLLQEKPFDIPYTLPSGRVVRLRGKWDSVDLITDELTGPHGGVYLQEDKTKGDIDKLQLERQLKFDLQTMLYVTALSNGEFAADICDEPIMGVRYNVVRRPLSGGKGSIRPHAAKATKTKFTPAESEKDFYERLRRDYLEADSDYWFFRVRCEITQHDVQVFRDTCLDPILETMCIWYDLLNGWPVEDVMYDVRNYGNFMNYRTPFGVYSALEEGGATEYDAYLESGSEAGLRRVDKLFPELQ